MVVTVSRKVSAGQVHRGCLFAATKALNFTISSASLKEKEHWIDLHGIHLWPSCLSHTALTHTCHSSS